MPLNPESPDVLVAVLGRQVQMFLESDVGLYLSQCCQAEVETSMEKLKTAKTMDDVKDYQNRIWRAESVMGWLRDALKAGEQAEEMIRESA